MLSSLCWLLGTSVLKIGILYPMEQAFLPKKVRCVYNQQGPCCSYSLATCPFSRRRGSVSVLSAHLYEATHRFPLSHTSRTCAPLDQTPNDLSSTRYACRSCQGEIGTHCGKRALTTPTKYPPSTDQATDIPEGRSAASGGSSWIGSDLETGAFPCPARDGSRGGIVSSSAYFGSANRKPDRGC
jgi:hypothetical protein